MTCGGGVLGGLFTQPRVSPDLCWRGPPLDQLPGAQPPLPPPPETETNARQLSEPASKRKRERGSEIVSTEPTSLSWVVSICAKPHWAGTGHSSQPPITGCYRRRLCRVILCGLNGVPQRSVQLLTSKPLMVTSLTIGD